MKFFPKQALHALLRVRYKLVTVQLRLSAAAPY